MSASTVIASIAAAIGATAQLAGVLQRRVTQRRLEEADDARAELAEELKRSGPNDGSVSGC